MKSKIKLIVLNLISFINDIVRRLKLRKTIISNLDYKIFKTKYKHTFFGYYDKSPFSSDDTQLLAIATNHDKELTEAKEAIVGYFDINDKSFYEIDTTTTWCWQQGCRLMWWDKSSVIYNKIVGGGYGSVVYNILKKKIVKEYNFAVYDKTSDNKYALSLNFSRLQHFRPGYGYCNFITDDDKKKVLEEDGVYLCNLENNTKKLLISISEIIAIENDERMDDAYHYLNHLKFSPDNETFVVYHIWNKNNKRYTRAIFANIKCKVLKVVDNKTFISHYTYKNCNEILIFTKLIKNGYYLYNLQNKNVKIINKKLKEDGHQSYLKNGNILTDTYPKMFVNEQKIIIFNEKSLNILARLYSPEKYKRECRCDLHPRLNNNQNRISVDIPTFQGRKICIFNINQNGDNKCL